MAPSDHADEVSLADLDPVMPQDVVGGRGVEIEIGQREMHEIGLAREVQLLAADRQRDIATLGAVNILGREALNEFHRLGEGRLELGEVARLFCIG